MSAQEIWLAVGDTSLADALNLQGQPSANGQYVLPVVTVSHGAGSTSLPGGILWDTKQKQVAGQREMVLPLLVFGHTPDEMLANWNAIERVLNAGRRRAQAGLGPGAVLWVRLLGSANYVFLDVLDGAMAPVDLGFPASDPHYAGQVTLACLPYARGAAYTVTVAGTITNGLAGTIFVPAVPGTRPALCRLSLTDVSTGGTVLQKIRLGRRSLLTLGATDFKAVYAVTPSGAGTAFADTGAVGGTTARLATTAAWQTFGSVSGNASVLALGGGKNQGAFGVLARMRSAVAAVGAPLNLSVTAAPNAGSLGNGTYGYMVVPRDGSGNAGPASGTQFVVVQNLTPSGITGGSVNVLDYEDFESQLFVLFETPPQVTLTAGGGGVGSSASIVIDAAAHLVGSYGLHLRSTGGYQHNSLLGVPTLATLTRALPKLPTTNVLSVQFKIEMVTPATQNFGAYALETPSVAPGLTGNATGGSIGAGTYYVSYTLYNATLGVETAPSPQASLVIGSGTTNELLVNLFEALPSGWVYRIYAAASPTVTLQQTLGAGVSGATVTSIVVGVTPPVSTPAALADTTPRIDFGNNTGLIYAGATNQWQFQVNGANVGLPFSMGVGAAHTLEFNWDQSKSENQVRVYQDGALVAGANSNQVPAHVTFRTQSPGTAGSTQFSEEYDVDNYVVADNYLGVVSVLGGSANTIQWDAGINDSQFDLDWIVGNQWYSLPMLGLATVTSSHWSYTHSTPIPSGTALRTPPSGAPALVLPEVKAQAGVAATTPMLLDGPVTQLLRGNGAWEMVFLGVLQLPPAPIPEAGNPLPWLLQLQAKGGSTAANLDCDAIWLFPIEEEGAASLVAEVPGDALATQRVWQIDTNRWGEASAVLLSKADGSQQGQALVTGAFTLGRGDNLIVVLAEAGGTLGGQAVAVPDVVNAQFTAVLRIVPLWDWVT